MKPFYRETYAEIWRGLPWILKLLALVAAFGLGTALLGIVFLMVGIALCLVT